MDNLAKCLRYYVADRLSNDPGWRNITVGIIGICGKRPQPFISNALVAL